MFRLLKWCNWGMHFYRIWHHVAGWLVLDIWRQCSHLILMSHVCNAENSPRKHALWLMSFIQSDTKKRELLKNPTKIEEIQEKKFIDRNWTIKTCLLRDSNPNYQCLKIMSCRWRPSPRMHSFTATTHFKSSRSFVSPCVCCMFCRMRLLAFCDIMHPRCCRPVAGNIVGALYHKL